MKIRESRLNLVLLLSSSNNDVGKEELIFLVCFLLKVEQWKEKNFIIGLQDFLVPWQESYCFLRSEFSRCNLTSINKYYLLDKMMGS